MSPANEGVYGARGKAGDVKIKSHLPAKVGTPANPHECWIRSFLLVLQKQLFRHTKREKFFDDSLPRVGTAGPAPAATV